MSTLGDKNINQTYDGLIKTSDEGAIGSTPKRLQDGTGQNLPVDVTTSQMRYYGTQDFTNAVITGIDAGLDGTSGTSGVNGLPGTSGTSGTSGGGGTPEFLPFWTASGALTTTGEINFFTSFATPIYLKQGQILEEWTSSISTAYAAGATFNVYLYNSQRRDTPSANGYVYPYQNVHTIGTGIAADVAGQVTVNMVDYTVPKTGVYYVYWTVTTDSGYWHKCNFSFSSGNAFQYTTGLSNQYNQNVSAAGRHWFSGASAGAPATLPSNGTGINDMAPDPWYIFKINS